MQELKNISSLAEDLEANANMLERQREERKFREDEIKLQSIIDKAEDKSKEITIAMSQKGAPGKRLSDIITQEAINTIDGDLTVPEYNVHTKIPQKVYIYNGIHWKLLEQQKYNDFVNKIAEKCGIDAIFLRDNTFMCQLYNQVAFNIAHNRNPYVPSDETWINMPNGTLVIKGDGTIKLREHNRDDFFKYTLDYRFDPTAGCPNFHKFLDEVLPDKELQELLITYIAYCFTTDIKLEKILVLLGEGSNGKSVILEIMEALFGAVNVCFIPLSDLTNDDEKRIHIENKLLNISYEDNKMLDTSRLKQLASGEPIDARELYVGTRTIHRYAKFVVSYNALPKAEATHGFFRRFLIIPFNVTINEKDADVDLANKLKKELPGILNWVLEALAKLMKTHRFPECEASKTALNNYKLSSDSVSMFINNVCESDCNSVISSRELNGKYRCFCEAEGIGALGRNTFLERFERNGFKPIERQRTKYYHVKFNDYE